MVVPVTDGGGGLMLLPPRHRCPRKVPPLRSPLLCPFVTRPPSTPLHSWASLFVFTHLPLCIHISLYLFLRLSGTVPSFSFAPTLYPFLRAAKLSSSAGCTTSTGRSCCSHETDPSEPVHNSHDPPCYSSGPKQTPRFLGHARARDPKVRGSLQWQCNVPRHQLEARKRESQGISRDGEAQEGPESLVPPFSGRPSELAPCGAFFPPWALSPPVASLLETEAVVVFDNSDAAPSGTPSVGPSRTLAPDQGEPS